MLQMATDKMFTTKVFFYSHISVNIGGWWEPAAIAIWPQWKRARLFKSPLWQMGFRSHLLYFPRHLAIKFRKKAQQLPRNGTRGCYMMNFSRLLVDSGPFITVFAQLAELLSFYCKAMVSSIKNVISIHNFQDPWFVMIKACFIVVTQFLKAAGGKMESLGWR